MKYFRLILLFILFVLQSCDLFMRKLSVRNGWFIIDIDNKTFNGYTDYKEFKDTLHTRYQIVIDTSSWRTPRSYYEEFKKERFMPWFPQQIPP